jgi:PadR family transcriptional regulator, regulatory protein PadR
MPWFSQQALKILRILLDHPTVEVTGAELIRATNLLSGSVYPILTRFERSGLLTSRWEEGDPHELGRPRRRFYRLTGEGHRVAFEAFRELALTPSLRPSEA